MPSKSRFSQHHHRSSFSLVNNWWLVFQCIGGHTKRGYFVWLTISMTSFVIICSTIMYRQNEDSSSSSSGSFRRGEFDFEQGDKSSREEQQNFNFQLNEDKKRILFWTKFYQEDSLNSYCIRPDTLRECPYAKCEFTTDKSLLRQSDAVLFHGRDLWGQRTVEGSTDKYIEMPRYRSEYQSWIFLMFEAPVHTWINLEPFNDVFNMTMSYRSDSDIHIPYGRVVARNRTDDTRNTPGHTGGELFKHKESSTKKKRLIAWSVSNCYKTPSRRNEVVHELHRHIEIDIYGDCGSFNCTPYVSLCDSGLRCHKYLADKYKFYLAFENSLCVEYITEKFFDSLYVGMVPIVYGYGDYSRVAPKEFSHTFFFVRNTPRPGSYIDASVFPTMKSLADYLNYLDTHPSEYEKYFEWKKHYKVAVSYFDDAWCSLCTKLWTSTINSTSSSAITSSSSTENNNNIIINRISSSSSNSNSNGYKNKHDMIRRQVKNLTDWWFHKSSNGSLKENACLSPTQLKWDTNIFSFYGFMYYPNYYVKLTIMYGVSFILFSTILICILRTIRTQMLYKNKGKLSEKK